jgi:hypothetical protein
VGAVRREKPQTVALSRKLPPVVDLAGAKIQVKVSKNNVVKSEDLVDIMSTKLRAELLKDRARGISLDDQHPDTELRCRVTIMEFTDEKTTKQNGNVTDAYLVQIGNLEASVEIYDKKTGRALDSENLKQHSEKWFLTGTMQQGKGIPNPLQKKPKLADEQRLPTPAERVSDLLEGMARKIAQRLVPVDERFDVELPSKFKDMESAAHAGNWGALKEKAESMPPLPKVEEDSCRLYLVGLANEALAYSVKDAQKAQDLLVNASTAYEKAKEQNKGEEYFNGPINRTQESLERYIALDKIAKTTKAKPRDSAPAVAAVPAAGSASRSAGPAAPVYDNAYLIKLKKSGSSDEFIISEINDATHPKFDISPAGITQLADAGLGDPVKIAVKNKMKAASAARPTAATKKQ